MSDILETFVQTIAQKLGEPNNGVIAQIRGVVAQLGPEKVAVLVKTVERLEQLGGCLVVHGHRRRTPGGLFLILARSCMSQAQRAAVWPELSQPRESPPSSLGGQSQASYAPLV